MQLLILSDIHANWPALSAVLAAEPQVNGVVCLGDIVNYGPHPVPCIDWVHGHARPGWVVQGNHDRAVGRDEGPRCSAPYRELAADMQRYTRKQISLSARDYLARLPTNTTQVLAGAVFFLCHAVPTEPLYTYAAPDDTRHWERECMFAGQPTFLLVGHTHLPIILRLGRTTIVNPGSVGLPKNGDPRASYALWRDGEVELRRVAYDVQATARDLAACAPQETARRLTQVLLSGGDLPLDSVT
jgi:predicted phosphodiesterase